MGETVVQGLVMSIAKVMEFVSSRAVSAMYSTNQLSV